MKYTIEIDEEQIKLLEAILIQVKPTIVLTSGATNKKKISKMEQVSLNIKEYRARKNKNK